MTLSLAFAALALAVACADGPATGTGAGTGDEATVAKALELFEIGRGRSVDRGAAARLFGALPGGSEQAALLDALERLGRAVEPRPVAVEPLAGLGRTAIELEAELPGGGMARYEVQIESTADGTLLVHSFRGPDVEWPLRRAPRDAGLSSSHLP